ncbi:S-adenosylmethionine decarboxylase [Rhodofomes roseus]|uniref:S-adenosylmethionine decarboxylase n=1 Tax=Rhodofomes roseus TaxID=34475 RepID=A0ABQ8K3K1_9APHY|nr:S-adenosylmethionine decarboxylase [Rhodofomes roseus]KAH9831224.1 S-adenosylmethionine decarboxylase [Rhodofomes roseus]
MAACPDDPPTGPFEGPEKLLEIWFKPSPADVPDAASATDGKFGLRKVPREVWADMLDIVQCKILSVAEGMEVDAYLLSESSLFVSPHRLILKTCGTTLNLLGVPRILEIARDHASLPTVYRLFYSRKAFMFPERQMGPHRDWRAEIDYLDNIFPNGAAYTIGKVNGDHWLLYMTAPGEDGLNGNTRPNTPLQHPLNGATSDEQANSVDADDAAPEQTSSTDDEISQDYTIEILMTHLSPTACAPFMTSPNASPESDISPSAQAMSLSSSLGISELFPPHVTTLDAYSFTPCGYSCNALLKWREDAGTDPTKPGEGYYTIHVTPESGWSYASFECNVPLPSAPSGDTHAPDGKKRIPDLRTLIRRVVNIFQPGRLTLTLFISGEDNSNAEEEDGESAVEAAQRAFKAALTLPCARAARGSTAQGTASAEAPSGFSGTYRRTDKINYEFGGYDLAFATFELRQ